MGAKQFTAERVVAKLRAAGVELAEGRALVEMARKLEIADQTARLKKRVADQALGNF